MGLSTPLLLPQQHSTAVQERSCLETVAPLPTTPEADLAAGLCQNLGCPLLDPLPTGAALRTRKVSAGKHLEARYLLPWDTLSHLVFIFLTLGMRP